jgi:hypothetical protein
MEFACCRNRGPRRSTAARATRVLSATLIVVLSLSCGGSRKRTASATRYNPDVARYRLLLRDNPVDSGAALRCYSECQTQVTPEGYLACLTKCPGFEVEKGVACASYEVPPEAACITARRLPNRQETDPGYKVIATIAGVVLMVSLGVTCASSSTARCGAYYYAAPGQRPITPY